MRSRPVRTSTPVSTALPQAVFTHVGEGNLVLDAEHHMRMADPALKLFADIALAKPCTLLNLRTLLQQRLATAS